VSASTRDHVYNSPRWFAVFAALFTYRSVLQSSYALFLLDNETDVCILNRQATSSPRLAGLLREIYAISNHHNISIYARHRRGIDNVLADFLSRPRLHGDGNIVETWRKTHPTLSHLLSSVCVVHSLQFVNRRVLP
jgi:hypothetical protein